MDSDFLKTLSRHGWSEHAAQAALALGGAYPWGPNADAAWRGQRMRDWVSASGLKDPKNQSAQLAYLNYDLRNNMMPVWAKLQAATTVEEAKGALGGYFGNLKGN